MNGDAQKKLKIVIATGIFPPDAGGPATYTRSIGKTLLEQGYEVQVVCYADGDWDRRQGNSEKEIALEVFRVSRENPLFFRYLKYFLYVYRCARRADIVYLQGPVSEGFPGMLAAWFAQKPTLMKIVGDYAWEIYMQSVEEDGKKKELLDKFIERRHKGKIGWLEIIERWTAKKAGWIIVPSLYLKSIVGRWGISSKKISVIYNAVNTFPPGLSREQFRDYFGYKNKQVIFTAVRAVPWKNIDFIVKLLPKILDQNVILVIAGEGPLYQSWKELAAKLLIEDRVNFVGKLNRREMAEWYRASDIFVLPSGYEGFPHVIPEAVSFGLHCLVSDQGGNPETEKMFGSYVSVLPYLDEYAWVRALSNICERKEGRLLPKKLYFDNMVEITSSLIEQIARTPKRKSGV